MIQVFLSIIYNAMINRIEIEGWYFVFEITFIVTYLLLTLFFRLYFLSKLQFTIGVMLIIFSLWGINAIISIFVYYCQLITSFVTMFYLGFSFPLYKASIIIIICKTIQVFKRVAHWIKNDYNVYETVETSPTTPAHQLDRTSTQSFPTKAPTNNQSQGIITSFFYSGIPKTRNDVKVFRISIMH